jgi:hypothetical protein
MPEVWEQKGHLRAGACLRGDFQEKLKGSALEGEPHPRNRLKDARSLPDRHRQPRAVVWNDLRQAAT